MGVGPAGQIYPNLRAASPPFIMFWLMFYFFIFYFCQEPAPLALEGVKLRVFSLDVFSDASGEFLTRLPDVSATHKGRNSGQNSFLTRFLVFLTRFLPAQKFLFNRFKFHRETILPSPYPKLLKKLNI